MDVRYTVLVFDAVDDVSANGIPGLVRHGFEPSNVGLRYGVSFHGVPQNESPRAP